VRGHLPDPGPTRRTPTNSPAGDPNATRVVPPGRGTPAGPRPDDQATRMVRGEPADDDFLDRDDNRPGAKGLRSEGPRPRGLSRSTRIALNVGKVLVALIAVVVLGATGVSWATLQSAENGVTTDNVIDPGGSSNNDQKHADGAEDILLVGLDSRTDVQGNPLPPDVLASLGAGGDGGEVNTDTMILLHIPDNGSQAVGVSIPRDSWVNIPGYQTNKINAAYGDAKGTATKQLKSQGDTDAADVERKSNEAGAKELITTIQNLAGVHIDHYAEVNLYGFDQLSQAIGGVPVCLNHSVNDPMSGANFQAGYFSVQGVQALQFVRQRHNIPGGSTDLQREARQQAFLASMAHKVLSAGTLTSPTELQNLISAIQKSITIDSGWNLVDFASKMAGMSSGSLKFETVPTVNIDYWPSGKVNVGTNAVEVNPAQIAAFVQGETGAGTPPPSNVGSTTNPSSTNTPSSGNSGTTVDVQNGSGVHNLASGVLSKLTKAGFGQGTTGNISTRSSSVIYFHAGQQDAANAVASALGGKITVAQSASVPSGHVWVYLGTHYSSEGISTASADWSISGVNQTLVPQAFTPAHSANPSSISDSGTAPPCVD
jgi:LCP family protein required for cell wall assembly